MSLNMKRPRAVRRAPTGWPAWLLAACASLPAAAQTNGSGQTPENVTVRLAVTTISQRKASFGAAYSGTNSLLTSSERAYTQSITGYLGVRGSALPVFGPSLSNDTELYVNPEFVRGYGLSNLVGLGGLSNGENQRSVGGRWLGYRARAFLRHTINLGEAPSPAEPNRAPLAVGTPTTPVDKNPIEVNVLQGSRADARRWVITAGNLSVMDLFDNNRYAHDPRTDFMNWSTLYMGAFDYAADSRGYSTGVAVERYHDHWTFRYGRFAQPKQSNGLALNGRLVGAGSYYGDQFEVERRHEGLFTDAQGNSDGRGGAVRLLVFRNVARMASFRDALAWGRANNAAPQLEPVRRLQSKWGWGLNLEQEVTEHIGVFGRYSRSDGATETYAFAEIDRSLLLGSVLDGSLWGRGRDELGLALVRNEASAARRDFLAAGGQGVFLGDGQLRRYQPERITEAYYNLHLGGEFKLTLNWQRIANPGYNAERGPITIWAVRFHTKF